MPQKQSALVVVPKDWINTAVRHLINYGRQSRSTGETHLVIGDLEDTLDPRGLWLKNINSTSLREDGSNVKMRFMIPWASVVALGVIDHSMQAQVGFADDSAVEPADITNHSALTPEEG